MALFRGEGLSVGSLIGKLTISLPSRLHLSTRSPSYHAFFRNTSRRWIMNEDKQLKKRYVKFNPTELQRVAGQAMGEDHCPFIVKLAEGGFNRVFLLGTNSGKEVIARIPTPIAGPPHYTTASEVAMMAFLRDILGVPIPKVFAYSTDSTNPVGAEYIIMERIEGVSLASRWLSLTTGEIAAIEQKLFAHSFPGYGSLYHRRDLQGDYCIGPISARQFWHGDRNETKIDRGPWLSPKDCFTSAARRETACILQHAKPRPRSTFLLPTTSDIEPSEYTSLLSKFLKLAPSLVPTNPDHTSPILRHPDLNLNNILLAPNSAKITSIIDWQDSIIFPLFMQAGYPAFCEHDSSKTQSLQILSLPDNFPNMSSEEQMEAKAEFRSEEANLYYTAATGLYNDIHWSTLKIPYLGMRHYLYQQTGYPWDGDVINLRAALVGITTSHRRTAMEESNEWNESEELLTIIRNDLGIDPEGGTEPENFEWASRRNLEYRLEMLRQAEEDERDICWRNWPFKDDTDFSSPPLVS
ncbi:aminoglycoside phosphotransferase family protein [Aspergillus niger CBS 101883]|uniref:aminoglycoside phosphotransferase family protein n=1 Tax=Aspergillus lacticoffeatus (strain CBS 101883) TaxID=1450533 RepID=UPI000D8052AC|nr:phosphotransferase enzyme family protein [Aspergillus niger CBS 101883]PYH58589.1 phosphotransferase enzyme family protein [Aspergillus niger CBS 101883]